MIKHRSQGASGRSAQQGHELEADDEGGDPTREQGHAEGGREGQRAREPPRGGRPAPLA